MNWLQPTLKASSSGLLPFDQRMGCAHVCVFSDEEYRLLRQNLFERFATSTYVPAETPVVPVARPRPRGTGSTLEGKREKHVAIELQRTDS